MAEVSTTPGRNWAPIITEQLEAVGCTVTGLPDYMTGEQADAMLVELKRQVDLMPRKSAS